MKIKPGMWIKTKIGTGMIYSVYRGDPRYHSGQVVDVADIIYGSSIIFDLELAAIEKHKLAVEEDDISPKSKRIRIVNLLTGVFPDYILEKL